MAKTRKKARKPNVRNTIAKKGGRPPKLDQALHDNIATLLRNGNFLETAAACVGIHSGTVRDWLARGAREKQRREAGLPAKRSEEKYVKFSTMTLEAAARAEASDVRVVKAEALSGNWSAAAWLLTHRFPRKWGREYLDVSAEVRSTSEVHVKKKFDPRVLEPEERAKLLELVEKMRSASEQDHTSPSSSEGKDG